LLLGGLALAGAALPATADAGEILSPADLDQVTAGFGALEFGAGAEAYGNLASQVVVDVQSNAVGNETSGVISGSSLAVAYGAGNAQAAAGTGVQRYGGGVFRSQSLNLSVGRPGSAYHAKFSGTIGLLYLPPQLAAPAAP
jgi:hypothetical protein